MITSITTSHENTNVVGENFSEEEEHFISNFIFILERNKTYSLEKALVEVQNYYNNPRVDALVNKISNANNLLINRQTNA